MSGVLAREAMLQSVPKVELLRVPRLFVQIENI
jgi:hypothetical protein